MIKKLTLGLMLSLGALSATTAATLERTNATTLDRTEDFYAQTSPNFKKTYEILSGLEPIEIGIIANNPKVYNSIYTGMIISSFHNYITPRMALSLHREVEKHLELITDALEYQASVAGTDCWRPEAPEFPAYAINNVINLREQLLSEIILIAHSEALKEMLKIRGNTTEMPALDELPSLLVLKHYQP